MKTLNFLFTFLIMVLISGCATNNMKSFTSNSNNWKPADFKPDSGVLLIQRVIRPKAEQRKMEEFMAKEYPYKYEFVDMKDLEGNDSKYADKNIYKFVLVHKFGSYTMNSSTNPSTAVLFDFYFIDRLNNKPYSFSGLESSYASKAFIKIIQASLAN